MKEPIYLPHHPAEAVKLYTKFMTTEVAPTIPTCIALNDWMKYSEHIDPSERLMNATYRLHTYLLSCYCESYLGIDSEECFYPFHYAITDVDASVEDCNFTDDDLEMMAIVRQAFIDYTNEKLGELS